MSTTNLTAGEVMDRSAALLNDAAKTDYTYVAQLPYLNMAIDELTENLEEANASLSNQQTQIISPQIVVPAGVGLSIRNAESPEAVPKYPIDLVEIQEVLERPVVAIGDISVTFTPLPRREFTTVLPMSNSLLYWVWEEQWIKFNPGGSFIAHEVRLKYIKRAINLAINENTIIGTIHDGSPIGTINARSYLAYKTAALCAMFIGENETRAAVLEAQAEKAIDRATNIDTKGRQQLMTRHRPFRASYKMRGGC